MTIKIICFEGNDGTGKSSIIRELNKKSKYKYICIDRFLGSSFCYNRNKEIDILRTDSELADTTFTEFYLIYLYCSDKDILIKRLKVKNDSDKIKLIERDKRRYEEYLDKTYFNTLELDTAKNSIEENVDEIIKFVEAEDE
jgi:thymidylate kinase